VQRTEDPRIEKLILKPHLSTIWNTAFGGLVLAFLQSDPFLFSSYSSSRTPQRGGYQQQAQQLLYGVDEFRVLYLLEPKWVRLRDVCTWDFYLHKKQIDFRMMLWRKFTDSDLHPLNPFFSTHRNNKKRNGSCWRTKWHRGGGCLEHGLDHILQTLS